MAKALWGDALWAELEPHLPKPKRRRRRYPGRKPIDNRQALTGILFVLQRPISNRAAFVHSQPVDDNA